MQDVYRTNRIYTRRNDAARRKYNEKIPCGYKRLLWQGIISIVIFVLAELSSLYGGAFSAQIKNEIRYTLDYTPDWQELYRAAQSSVKDIYASFDEAFNRFTLPVEVPDNADNSEGS